MRGKRGRQTCLGYNPFTFHHKGINRMQLYFIRHGQSVNNAGWGDPNYKESPDPMLTETGVAQAQVVAEHLGRSQEVSKPDAWNAQNEYGYGITHVYASLMERAALTASYTARRLPQVPFEAWDIHESGGIFGRDGEMKLMGLAGKPRSWYEANVPGFTLPETLDEGGWWNRPFETEEECQLRAERVWSDLLARHCDRQGGPEDRVIFVSHGGFFMHLMCAILNLPWKNASNGLRSWFLLHNCSISRVDVRDRHVTICYLNRTDHLSRDLIT
jgi:2,3-bisphosphoglycerate-dependent phosphoglycerate mutase